MYEHFQTSIQTHSFLPLPKLVKRSKRWILQNYFIHHLQSCSQGPCTWTQLYIEMNADLESIATVVRDCFKAWVRGRFISLTLCHSSAPQTQHEDTCEREDTIKSTKYYQAIRKNTPVESSALQQPLNQKSSCTKAAGRTATSEHAQSGECACVENRDATFR